MKRIFDIKITRDRKRRTLRMNQTHYLSEILDDLHMSANKHHSTTLSMCDYQALRSFDSKNKRIDFKTYQHKVDKLMYVVMHIRSNICFALERLNQYLNDLAKHHKSILKTLLRYVQFIIDFDITYERFESNESLSLNLKAFSNSNYVANKFNRKSILEYVYMFVEKSIA